MNEHQIDAIQIVLNNEVILSALHQLLHEAIEDSKPVASNFIQDETLGQNYRAYSTAQGIVAVAFSKMESHRKSNPQGKQEQRER